MYRVILHLHIVLACIVTLGLAHVPIHHDTHRARTSCWRSLEVCALAPSRSSTSLPKWFERSQSDSTLTNIILTESRRLAFLNPRLPSDIVHSFPPIKLDAFSRLWWPGLKIISFQTRDTISFHRSPISFPSLRKRELKRPCSQHERFFEFKIPVGRSCITLPAVGVLVWCGWCEACHDCGVDVPWIMPSKICRRTGHRFSCNRNGNRGTFTSHKHTFLLPLSVKCLHSAWIMSRRLEEKK